MQSTDILVVGSGLTGLALANALANSKWSVTILDQKAFTLLAKSADSRPITLTRGSVCLLDQWGVWLDLAPFAMPISQVHVSEKGGFGFTRIDADSMRVPGLGYVIELPDLLRVMYQKAKQSPNIHFDCPTQITDFQKNETGWTVNCISDEIEKTYQTSLLIAADGQSSSLRQLLGLTAKTHDYEQGALVSNITLMREHGGVAYERFIQTGAIALLPMKDNRCGLVWSDDKPIIEELLALSDEAFLSVLQKKFGFRLGRFVKAGKRQVHPLSSVVAEEQIAHHFVLMGNAAHTQHPLAAQGFNLGIRDISKLINLLSAISQPTEIPHLLKNYEELCQRDQSRTIHFTHSLASIFTSQIPLSFSFRNLVMLGLDALPLCKRKFARMAMGLE